MTKALNSTIRDLGRRLRLGVIGGGPGSFIGPVHRAAARLDDHYEVVAAVLSRNPETTKSAAAELGIAPDRAYPDLPAMLEGEAARGDGIDVLAVMTANAGHFPAAKAALERGLDVIADKPLATTLEDARALVRLTEASGRVFCCTYNYRGYPMVRQAMAMVRNGELGAIRQVQLEYIQGHLAAPVPADQDPAANWRFLPEESGPSLILGDIGTHALHLGTFIGGLELTEVAAELGSAVPGRKVHDRAHLMLRFDNGARGGMWVTNSAAGGEHGLSIRIFGEKGGLEWHQEQPNHLLHRPQDGFARLLARGRPGLSPEAERATRIVLGHPEGYQEAFANLYLDAAEAIIARLTGKSPDPLALDFPTVTDGARGIAFIDAAIASDANGGRWTDCRLEV
jgi:predicted dehydrogenase